MFFPIVSVIIPTYNRGYILHRAIESVLRQTYTHFELIVVDDGSTDDTKSVIAAFGAKLQFIQKEHSGQVDTRNMGFRYSKGDIIASLDSDDIWHDDYLEKSVGYMLSHNLDIFGSNWEHRISPTKKKVKLNYFFKSKKSKTDNVLLVDYCVFRHNLFKNNIIPSSGLLLKKSCMPFGWNSLAIIGDDWFLQLEVILKNPNCRIGLTNDIFWEKSRDGSNICDGREGEIFRKLYVQDLYLLLDIFSQFLKDKEKELILIKIIQNKILIFYYKLLEGKVDIQLLKKITFSPLLLTKSIIVRIEKVMYDQLRSVIMSLKSVFNK